MCDVGGPGYKHRKQNGVQCFNSGFETWHADVQHASGAGKRASTSQIKKIAF